MDSPTTDGPLAGLRVIELAGQGPGPHAAMILGDWGAEVIRVVRPNEAGSSADWTGDAQLRNRTIVVADLKSGADVAAVLDLISHADVLIEGFRPGVVERLGLGPDPCTARNQRLIYARMTGWGQTGPLSQVAGHDINYLSVTGMLDSIGADDPVPPLNLVGDYGGGSMYLLSAILAAVVERHRSQRGQVLDVSIVDGTNLVAQNIWSMRAMGVWREGRQSNILDGGAPFYGVYRCADDRHIAVGAMEQSFYRELIGGLGLVLDELPDRDDTNSWAQLRAIFAATFATRTQDEWVRAFDGRDACVSPVLTMTEALEHPQQVSRRAFGPTEFGPQTLPGPVFSRTSPPVPQPPGSRIRGAEAILAEWANTTDQVKS